MKNVGHVALSGKQVVAILLLMAAGIFALVASAVYENQPRDKVLVFRWHMGEIAGACGVVSVGLLTWHALQVRKPDVHPDILAGLFGDAAVGELSSLHFFAFGKQIGSRIRVLVFLQNVYAGRCTGRFRLEPITHSRAIPEASKPHRYAIQPAEVVVFWRDLPYPNPSFPLFSFEFENRLLRKPWAKRVRFRRRTAVRTGLFSNALTFATIATGHIGYFEGSRLTIPLTAIDPAAADTFEPSDWATVSLWNPDEARDIETIRRLIQQLTN